MHLAMGSAFWHGSHTHLGYVMDNWIMNVLAYLIHQSSVSNLPGYDTSSVLRDLSLEPRAGSAIEINTQLTFMFAVSPVEIWNSTILGFDMPNYWRTFGSIVATLFTLTLEDCVADHVIDQLIDLFNYPEQEQDFLLNHYLPTVSIIEFPKDKFQPFHFRSETKLKV